MNESSSIPPHAPPAEKEGHGPEAAEFQEPAPLSPLHPSSLGKVQRSTALSLTLFLATCLCTFATRPVYFTDGDLAYRLLTTWRDGLVYMAAVMGILLAHEMGHFLMTLWHRIPASYPLFIPVPPALIPSPFGTMGAVIAMEGSKADRRQLFDIGIAGPLAGLAVCVPIVVLGIQSASAYVEPQKVVFHQPMGMALLVDYLRPELAGRELVMSPLFTAGWLGLLVTGLNMLPVSQLDGGHVIYALLRHKSFFVAHAFVFVAIVYMVATANLIWLVMLALIILIGVNHPPTANDSVRLGPVRTVLGWASLVIPILCFPPAGITVYE